MQTITVRACPTDTPQAKFSHIHLWNDDERKYSICTSTFEYQQIAQKAQYESEHDL